MELAILLNVYEYIFMHSLIENNEYLLQLKKMYAFKILMRVAESLSASDLCNIWFCNWKVDIVHYKFREYRRFIQGIKGKFDN